jgi:tRNA(Ile)-lysidine synthase
MPVSFEKMVEAAIRTHRMLDPEDGVVVAVSGGPDSMALLHALWHLRELLSIRLVVAHLNHQLRGRASDEDAEFVARFAASLDLPCIVETADVYGYCRDHRCSVETGAREVRYAFLERVARAHRAEKIATGHTADDQAETILMRLIRGSGLSGLSGIRPVREGRIIRPLLHVTRDQVMAYLVALRLPVRVDATNTETNVLRNRIRHHLLPLLQGYNPEIHTALCRLGEVLRAESAYLDEEVEKRYGKVVIEAGARSMRVDASAWGRIPLSLQRRMIRRMAEQAGGDPERLTYEHIERVRGLMEAGRTGQLMKLPGALLVERRRTSVLVRHGVPAPFHHPVPVPGEIAVPETGFRLITQLLAPEEAPLPGSPSCAFFDADAVEDPLAVRSRQPGDRMAPAGMAGTKSLKALFNEWDIPRLERDSVPILTSGARILWVIGRRLSRWGGISDRTRRVLMVRVE